VTSALFVGNTVFSKCGEFYADNFGLKKYSSEFLVEALKEFENGMLLTELHAHMNDGFMSRVLNRRGITQEKFINVLSTFDGKRFEK